MDQIVLYATEGCHLCDLATIAIEQALCAYPDRRVAYVDIVESDDLMACYAERIPVLKNESNGAELSWPFTAEDVQKWLA